MPDQIKEKTMNDYSIKLTDGEIIQCIGRYAGEVDGYESYVGEKENILQVKKDYIIYVKQTLHKGTE